MTDELQGCDDCPATVHTSTGASAVTDEPVLVVVVEHEPTCPWLARVAPDGATLAPTPDRLLRHVRRDC